MSDPRRALAYELIQTFVDYATGLWVLDGQYYRVVPTTDSDGTPWMAVQNGSDEDLNRLLAHGRKI